MTELIPRLEHAVDGLFFPSESDAPLTVFVWPADAPFSPQALLAHAGCPETTAIETTDLDHFFDPVTTPRAWHGDAEREQIARFTVVRDLLAAELSNITVYKIGTITIRVYILGRSADGATLGLTTTLVET